MSMILFLSQSSSPHVNIIFCRPREETLRAGGAKDNEVYATFYSPRKGIPPKLANNDFRFPMRRLGLYHHMISLLKLVEYEMPDQQISVHFGWPMSSWLDRISIGVMVYFLIRLPRLFPQFNFTIDYKGSSPINTGGNIQE